MRPCYPQTWKQVAYILERVTMSLESRVTAEQSDETSLSVYFESTEAPKVTIVEYLARIRLYTRCSDSCFALAFIYIDRVLKKNPLFGLNPRKIHRLVLSAIVVAVKYLDETCANNKAYSIVGGISVDELNFLEILLISLLELELYIDPGTYYKYCLLYTSDAADE
eukprot:TRINITY_DN352_c0_g1_i11.p1 TRINITY_DN352_c0_g1~~TRINITY_DN352_c0_g1_i11.p1  ORF type:complete len:166 (+),score=11.35 TRINITY_DN352_c0_g1_i11:102-599(+)